MSNPEYQWKYFSKDTVASSPMFSLLDERFAELVKTEGVFYTALVEFLVSIKLFNVKQDEASRKQLAKFIAKLLGAVTLETNMCNDHVQKLTIDAEAITNEIVQELILMKVHHESE